VFREVYRYSFEREVSMAVVEESLVLAVLAVECLHGESVVRLEAGYCLEEDQRVCAVDATTAVGRDVARIFTGFLTKELGEEAFRVTKATGTDVQTLIARRRN